MLRNLSFRRKLLLWVMPTLVLGLLTLSSGAYWYINKLIEEELTRSMLATTGKTAENINTWFKTLILEPETIASTPAAKAINNDFKLIDTQNINRHKFLHEKYPDIFQDIYAANRNGEYHTVQKNGNDYSLFIGDISTRDYFNSIMAGGPAQITPPLISRTTGLPTIFIVAPIKDGDNRPQGLIGVGISLEYVQKIAEGLKASQTGYGVVVAKDGTFIYHPNKDFVLQKKVTELDDSSVSEVGKLMISGGSGVHRYTFNGQKKVAFFQPIPITGWSVATVVPEAELFAPAARMVKSLAIITLVVLILVGITILMAARHLTQPLHDLASHAQEIAAGNLVVRTLEVDSQDEVGQLAANFHNMTTQLVKRDAELRKAYDELELRVQERTTALAEANDSLQNEISERKHVEEALRAERSLFMGGPTIVFLWKNAEGWPVEYVSPNVYQILGYTVEDFFSGKVSYMSIIHPDDLERTVAEVSTYTKRQAAFFEKVYRIITASGETRWFLDFTVVKRDLSGEVTHYHGYMNDITEHKLFETKMAQLDRLNAIGEVAAGIGHEVRNPLTTVRGYLQHFQTKDEFAKYQDHFGTMIEELDRANSIITEFLSLAKNKSLEKKQGNLNNVIQALFPILQAETFQKGHQLQVEIGEIPDSVFDEKEIRQLVLNMVRNGLDAMERSGVVTIKTYSENDNIILAIKDTGSGIPAEVLDKLGTPFVTTKDRGTGLGLSICYRIAARHGASIEVSTGSEGTSFFIIFCPYHQHYHN